MTVPFTYPSSPHVRRHGPRGYAAYESYRPWLRDEFAFRCVFCLARETWGPLHGQYAIDHFVPTTLAPDRKTDYENMLYTCVTCNGVKGSREVPDPLAFLIDGAVHVGDDGVIHAETLEAAQLIDELDLNEPRRVEYRTLWIAVVRMARRSEPELLRRLLGYPADLPNLEPLKPPQGNSRPEGVAGSHYARRECGGLPENY